MEMGGEHWDGVRFGAVLALSLPQLCPKHKAQLRLLEA